MPARVLVAYGSRRGSTAEIAQWIGDELRNAGLQADVRPANDIRDVAAYDAAVVGGALYVKRWPRETLRFVRRNASALRARPLWLFSSGPLDRSADEAHITPPPAVEKFEIRLGARDHATFGGKLDPEPEGLLARAIAKKWSGDFRNEERIREWARGIARSLELERK